MDKKYPDIVFIFSTMYINILSSVLSVCTAIFMVFSAKEACSSSSSPGMCNVLYALFPVYTVIPVMFASILLHIYGYRRIALTIAFIPYLVLAGIFVKLTL